MAGDTDRALPWLRFYKGIACVGLLSALMPIADMCAYLIARQFSPLVAVILAPVLFGAGYLIQTLLLGRSRAAVHGTDLDFSFESIHARISPRRVVLACLVSTGLSVACGVTVGQMLARALGGEASPEFGIPLLAIVCAVCAVAGCLSVPFRFHQLLSLRTMPEFIGVMSLLFALRLWIGDGANLLMTACFLLYFLCLALLMNQEYTIRYSYSSATCHATPRLRRAGLRAACLLWLRALLAVLPVLSLLTLCVTSFRLVLFADESTSFANLFSFPFPALPAAGATLFVLGILLILAFAVWGMMRLRYRHDETKRQILSFLQWLRQLVLSVLYLFGIEPRPKRAHTETVEEVMPNYVDTVTQLTPTGANTECSDYRSFYRQMKRLPDTNAQYRFAYCTLIRRLGSAQIGIQPNQTPLEMAEIIRNKTNIEEIDRWTQTFLYVAYADATGYRARTSDVKNICGVLQSVFKK